ncbi:MAG: acyltransferase [Rubrivivax sp.]|nr:acyltransferase [Rubrivivax sp.]MDP3612619.1 acyltransferase [Rubrivivax sp.]
MITPLPKAFSIYLDLVRFLAACLVYVYHSNQRWLIEPILPLAQHGHSAVIVFFVLSGYVIAYVTDTKERDWATYAASRLSRVYSVALPTIVLTLLLDSIGRQLLAAPYGYPFDWFSVRILGSLLMANEVWFISITSFSNVPYWSICYEVWYYVAFGLLTFLPRHKAWALVGLLALLLGPKVVLLAPVWALGVVLYRWRRLAEIAESTGWALLVGSVIGIALYLHFGIEKAAAAPLKALLGDHGFEQLAFSRWFIGDYVLAPLVMLHFAGMRRVAGRMEGLFLAVENPVRLLAAYTFTLYLLHQPLFLFWGAVLQGDNSGYGNWVLVTLLVAVCVAVVGTVTENRRRGLTRWIKSRLVATGSRLAGAR